ncbi:MAG: hypothetical protein ACKOWI_01200 [Rhodoluna sp.]
MTWRRLLADFSNLSNGVFYYPLLITFAWLTYNSVFSINTDKDIQVVAPLLALFVGSLVSIATERQDRVADRITIEMGGKKSRLLLRMVALFLTNAFLLALGLIATFFQQGSIGSSGTRTIVSSLFVCLVVSTLGVIAANYMPHPLVALGTTFLLMSWGGPDPNRNWGLSHLLAMLRANATGNWLYEAITFAAPWLIGTVVLLGISLIQRRLEMKRFFVLPMKRKTRLRFPKWLNERRSFTKLVATSAATDPLPLVALVFCIGLYSSGTLNLAAKLAAYSPGRTFFSLLPGVILANVIPALILAGNAQRRETKDQESLLYQSQRHATQAQILQQLAFISISLVAIILTLAVTLNVPRGEPVVARTVLCALILSPGLATIGVQLNNIIRLPLLSGVVSYLFTLPELFLAKLIPSTQPFLPSSLFSILAGGESGYTRVLPPSAKAAAYCLAITLVALPIFQFFSWRQLGVLKRKSQSS